MKSVAKVAKPQWDDLPWKTVDTENVDISGRGDAIFFGLEELDGNAYLVDKSSGSMEIRATKSIQKSAKTVDTDKEAMPEKKEKNAKSSSKKEEKTTKANSNDDTTTVPIVENKGMDSSDVPVLSRAMKQKLMKKRRNAEKNAEKKAEKKAAKKKEQEEAGTDSIEVAETGSEEGVNDKHLQGADLAEIAPKHSQWGSISLHKVLRDSLVLLGFENPTAIQSASIPVVCRGSSDLIGAAETGSGKTLAFCLPMVNTLIDKWEEVESARISGESHCPFAAIIVPTRELALQINGVLKQVCLNFRTEYRIEIACVVGGMSEHKQRRQLDGRPLHVLIATPGRVCELMQDETIPIFRNMNRMRFLIVDEADRIVEDGHFPELYKIFARITSHEDGGATVDAASTTSNNIDGENEVVENFDYDELLEGHDMENLELDFAVPGFDRMPSEAELAEARRTTQAVPLDELEDAKLAAKKGSKSRSNSNASNSKRSTDEQNNCAAREPKLRQTLLFSATALGAQSHYQKAKKAGTSKQKLKGLSKELADQLPVHLKQLLQLVAVRPSIDIIDITSPDAINTCKAAPTKKGNKDDTTTEVTKDSAFMPGGQILSLPKTLAHSQINVPAEEKDLHAYFFINSNPHHRTLLFVNSIKSARRVDGLLRALGINCRTIHSQLQQRQRLRALDAFKASPSGVLVATDVAARGLDIEKISSVLHYDIARSTELYVHRSGRSARANQSGMSVSLVAPDDALHHTNICSALGVGASMDVQTIDPVVIEPLKERAKLAKKIFTMSFVDMQAKKDDSWVKQNSIETGLAMDEYTERELVDESMLGKRADNKKELFANKRKLNKLLEAPVSSVGTHRRGFIVIDPSAL